MKLLVLAQTPPPLHGQSLMVQTLVEGLPTYGIALRHVNLALSRDAADIGRWRPGKIGWTLVGVLHAVIGRARFRCDTLYYVPAPPGKRGALYRDWIVMLFSRAFFRRTVLHWHAAGLGEWLETKATPLERVVTRALLGRADLAIVLATALRSDGDTLRARRVAVVPNGIADPDPVAPAPPASRPCRVLFLGLCSEAKGLFATIAAVIAANRREQKVELQPAFVLMVAGPFANDAEAARFHALAATHPQEIRYAGIAGAEEKKRLFEACHCLCLPTQYAAEAQPLVLLEALAHDRPIVATRWRGIPEVVSAEVGHLVDPGSGDTLGDALRAIRTHPPPPGICRARFLDHYTKQRHLATLAAALSSLDSGR
jgi:glycosyltransferase involved in cell wall biosynthesis